MSGEKVKEVKYEKVGREIDKRKKICYEKQKYKRKMVRYQQLGEEKTEVGKSESGGMGIGKNKVK